MTLTATLPSSLPGDVNNNGVVDATDVALALRIAGGMLAADAGQVSRGHINSSGPLALTDAVRIVRKAAGL